MTFARTVGALALLVTLPLTSFAAEESGGGSESRKAAENGLFALRLRASA